MQIDKHIDSIVDDISRSIDGVRVVRAYPHSTKPTRLTSPIIAVNQSGEESRYFGLGEYARLVDLKIKIGVYAPCDMGMQTVVQLVDRVTSLSSVVRSASVSAGAITADRSAGTISADIVVAYTIIVGDNDEQQ